MRIETSFLRRRKTKRKRSEGGDREKIKTSF